MLKRIMNLTKTTAFNETVNLQSFNPNRLIFDVTVPADATETVYKNVAQSILDKINVECSLNNPRGESVQLIKGCTVAQLFALSDISDGCGGSESLKKGHVYFSVMLGNIVLTGDDHIDIGLSCTSAINTTINVFASDDYKGQEFIFKYDGLKSMSGQNYTCNMTSELYCFGTSATSLILKDYFGEQQIPVDGAIARTIIDGKIENSNYLNVSKVYADTTNVGMKVSFDGIDDLRFIAIEHVYVSGRESLASVEVKKVQNYLDSLV